MNLRNVSLSAVRQLQSELDQFEKQAKTEMSDPQTHWLGVLRRDLIEQCRYRLMFVTHMVKDAQEHSDERRRRLDEE
jgi:hypothetical protein